MTYCYYCGEPLLPDDLIVPEEWMFHGEMHLECEPLWSEQYYGTDVMAPWERWWPDYLSSINGELTTPAGCVIIPAHNLSGLM